MPALPPPANAHVRLAHTPPAQHTLPAPEAPRAATPAVTQLASDALFRGADEVQILHAGAVYRLKRTALGKLILTK